MKIAVASSGLGHVRRGVESWAQALAEGLAGEGEDVTLYGHGAWNMGSRLCRRQQDHGTTGQQDQRTVAVGDRESGELQYVGLSYAKRSDWGARGLARVMPGFTWRWGMKSAYGWEQLFFWWRMKPHLVRGGFDVLHLQEPMVALMAQEYFAKRRGPSVILAHGTEEDMQFLDRITHVQELSPHYYERHGALTRTLTPALSQGEMEEGERIKVRGDKDARKRFCVPNFVDTEMFCPRDQTECRKEFGIPADRFVVLSVGAINRHRKRMDYLISEFAAASLEDAVLVIAGACDEEGRRLVDEGRAALGERLYVLENQPFEVMPKLYSCADLFVLCAHEEIFGIAFLEAMASGVPCIGHRFPVTEWIIGEAGSCVDMLESGALARELQRYGKAEVREMHADVARRRVEKMFSWKAVYPQMMEMYRGVVEGG